MINAMMDSCVSLVGLGKRFTEQAAMVKLFSTRSAQEAAVEAMQIHGGYGYMKEYGVEKLMRDNKILEIAGGTSEILRLVISRALLV